MKKKDRATIIQEKLDKLYPKTPVPLNHRNNFELLIAVLLSAQTTDERVNKVTPNLFKEANTAEKMQKLHYKTIHKLVKTCGLAPKKSKAILALSKILVQEYNGQVPSDINQLEKLPGVGHKTASVVISQGFGQAAFPVDTHIHRLAQRWGLTNGKSVEKTEQDLKKIFPKETWNKLHLQIIFYGREFCLARQCFGIECDICKTCYPNRKKPIVTQKQ